MSLPSELFNATTLAGLAGCSALVWVIVNALRTFMPGQFRKWMILVVGAFVATAAHVATGQDWSLPNILVVVGNACLLALLAVGSQEAVASATSTTPAAAPEAAPAETTGRSWLDSWVH